MVDQPSKLQTSRWPDGRSISLKLLVKFITHLWNDACSIGGWEAVSRRCGAVFSTSSGCGTLLDSVWMLLRLRSVRGFLLLSLMGVAPAKAATSPAHMTKTSQHQNYVGTFAVSTGLGVFQDIQVPLNDYFGLRGDGNVPGEENGTHIGLPFSVSLQLAYPAIVWQPRVAVNVLHMPNLRSSKDTYSASYGRFDLMLGGAYRLDGVWPQPLAEAGFLLRRSLFRNVSTGHFVDAVMPRLGMGVDLSQVWAAQAFVATSLIARLGYSSGKGFDSGAMPQSSASVSEFGGGFTYQLDPQSALTLELDQERTHVSIQDVSSYNRFGLNVASLREQSRDYQLTTSTFKIGLHKNW